MALFVYIWSFKAVLRVIALFFKEEEFQVEVKLSDFSGFVHKVLRVLSPRRNMIARSVQRAAAYVSWWVVLIGNIAVGMC